MVGVGGQNVVFKHVLLNACDRVDLVGRKSFVWVSGLSNAGGESHLVVLLKHSVVMWDSYSALFGFAWSVSVCRDCVVGIKVFVSDEFVRTESSTSQPCRDKICRCRLRVSSVKRKCGSFLMVFRCGVVVDVSNLYGYVRELDTKV